MFEEIHLSGEFDAAIERVTQALASEGFGIITQIDMRETFQKKLDVAFRPYVILGACNPGLAHQAVSAAPEIGLFLPCNVTVEQADDGIVVRIPNAEELMKGAGDGAAAALGALAQDANARLARVSVALRV